MVLTKSKKVILALALALAATAGFSDGEVQLITEPDSYQLKFKAMEWVEQLRQWLLG